MGKCLDFRTVLAPFNYVHGVLNAATDWIFAIIPIFVVRSTQMTPKARASVIAILALGAAGSIASLVRLAYVNVLGVKFEQLVIKAPDYAIASIIELGLGITAASLATLRPLFSKFIDKAANVMTSSRGKKSKRTANEQSTDHGIFMERSVNIGYEHNVELGALPEPRRQATLADSGIGSPIGKHFSVSVRMSEHQEIRKSHSSSERSLLHSGKC